MDQELKETLEGMGQRTAAQIESLHAELAAMRQETAEQFAGVQEQFAGVQEQFAGVHEQFAGVREQFAGVREQFAGVREQFAGVKEQFAGVQEQFAAMRQENAAMHAETRGLVETHRREFHVVTEGLKHEIQLVAEGVRTVDEKVDRRAIQLLEVNAETRNLVELSFANLDRRVRVLEDGRMS